MPWIPLYSLLTVRGHDCASVHCPKYLGLEKKSRVSNRWGGGLIWQIWDKGESICISRKVTLPSSSKIGMPGVPAFLHTTYL